MPRVRWGRYGLLLLSAVAATVAVTAAAYLVSDLAAVACVVAAPLAAYAVTLVTGEWWTW